MKSERIVNKILGVQENRKTKLPCVKEVHSDLEKKWVRKEDRNQKNKQ